MPSAHQPLLIDPYMKTIILTFLLTTLHILTYGMDLVEQKIIIQDGYYHYITINEETQLATLHKGKTTQSLQQNTHYPLPMGRNFDEPFIQFSWDMKQGFFIGNNVMRNPLNDLAEGIKKIAYTSITDPIWKEKDFFELIMTGVDDNMWMYNAPFVALRKNDYSFENYYHDMTLIDSTSLLYLLSNKGKSTLWKYENEEWASLFTAEENISNPFSLLYFQGSAWIIQQNKVIEINPKTGSVLADYPVAEMPTDYIIIEDRDQQCIGFLNRNIITSELPFVQLIKKYPYKITKS